MSDTAADADRHAPRRSRGMCATSTTVAQCSGDGGLLPKQEVTQAGCGGAARVAASAWEQLLEARAQSVPEGRARRPDGRVAGGRLLT